MIGQVVSIKDKALVNFFYPSFVEREEITPLDFTKDIIYIGAPFPDLQKYLESKTKRFISLVGRPTLDLSTDEALIEWVEQQTKPMIKQVKEQFLDLAQAKYQTAEAKKELILNLKQYYLINQCNLSQSESVGTWDLYTALVRKTITSVLKEYFTLIQEHKQKPHAVERSILTFLLKASKPSENTNVKPAYKILLDEANKAFGLKIKQTVPQVLMSDADPVIRTINLLITLKQAQRKQ